MADIEELEKQLKGAKKDPCEHEKQLFRVENISNDNSKVKYYTRFSTFSALMVCYNVLGPSVNKLNYWSSGTSELKSNKGRKRLLSSLNELFLLLVRLLLGLFEQDLAYRFCVSQSTVSRIIITWIDFLYLQFKQIPIWAPRSLVYSNMPEVFKTKYPTTRVIIDATEISVEQPALPELQQITFSNYKDHNTYKGLIGISPSGVVTFISDLYFGSISDKELTRSCGLLDLLEAGDSEEDLELYESD